MSATTSAPSPLRIVADEILAEAVVESVEGALTMCGHSARCVGVSSVPLHEGCAITGVIGVHGKVSGFLMLTMAERTALHLAQGLLGESCDQICAEVVDAVGEVTNIVSVVVKGSLSKTSWAFTNITVPSIIVGQNYHVAYAGGLSYVSAAFERTDNQSIMLEDRLLHASLSLLRL